MYYTGVPLKRQYNSNMKGYIYPFVMVIYMLYLSLIAIYTSQFNLQLKRLITLNHIMINKLNYNYKRKIFLKNKINTPLILIGFMGTGKTTLGKYIAQNNQLSFVDLDEFIVQQEGKTIPEIFEQLGEKGFRNLEFKYLKNVRTNLTSLLQAGYHRRQ